MIDTKEKYGLEISHAIGLFTCMILVIIQLVLYLAQLFDVGSIQEAILPIIFIGLLMGFAYYALIGYKKPHGNSFKYLILFYVALSCFLQIYQASLYPLSVSIFGMIKLIALAYVSGRLNRIEQNKYILGAILLIDLGFDVYNLDFYISINLLNINTFFSSISSLLFSSTIALAYFTRYTLHKEAGFEDKK